MIYLNSARTNAQMGRVDRNWTKSSGRPSPMARVLLVGELTQVPHYPERGHSGWLSPPKLTLMGQAGSTYTRVRLQL